MTQESQLITTDTQSAQLAEILPKLESLRIALEEQNPNVRNYLKLINENLRLFPDLVHLLSDEQITPIYSALRAETQVFISAKESKKRGAKPSATLTNDIMGLL